MRRSIPAILALLLANSAGAQTIKLPDKAERDTIVTVSADGQFDSVVWFVDPPTETTRYSERQEGATLLLAGQPGKYRIRLVTLREKTLTGQTATLVILDDSPAPPPNPGPTPPPPGPAPEPIPIDPDIIPINPDTGAEKFLRVAPVSAVVPDSIPVRCVLILDRASADNALASLQDHSTLNDALKSFNAFERSYDPLKSPKQIDDYGFTSWVAKYGVPVMLWQRTSDDKVVYVTKNPTVDKAVATIKAIRGAK